MASLDHLAVLDQGVVAWNYWRNEHPDIVPDLRGAMLRDRRLVSVDPEGEGLAAYLRGDFDGIDLRGALLHGTDLRGGLLDGALLEKAQASGAVFDGAHLHGANLQGADLSGASLAEASLRLADFHQASSLNGRRMVTLGIQSLLGSGEIKRHGRLCERVESSEYNTLRLYSITS